MAQCLLPPPHPEILHSKVLNPITLHYGPQCKRSCPAIGWLYQATTVQWLVGLAEHQECHAQHFLSGQGCNVTQLCVPQIKFQPISLHYFVYLSVHRLQRWYRWTACKILSLYNHEINQKQLPLTLDTFALLPQTYAWYLSYPARYLSYL